MKRTVGSTDQIIRVVLAIAIGYFAYSTNFKTAWLQIVLYVVSVILLVTALTGRCLMYSIFKTNTCKLDK